MAILRLYMKLKILALIMKINCYIQFMILIRTMNR